MKPARIRLSRSRGWRLQPISLELNGLPAINVTRAGRWGNPFRVDMLGRELAVLMHREALQGMFAPHRLKHLTPDQFREINRQRIRWLARLPADPMRAVKLLEGHNLACTCALDEPCHADTYLELANP